jgi:hypothetical protein
MPEFKLERYFARWEFKAPFLLCASHLEPLRLNELLELADTEGRSLWENLSLGYTDSAGHPLLRAEIANLYETAREARGVCPGILRRRRPGRPPGGELLRKFSNTPPSGLL